MYAGVVVYVSLVIFNYVASISQGLTGFGDAVVLHVLWYTASVMAPAVYNATPLGAEPVRAVTLLMYARIIFSAPVMVFLSMRDGIFSLTMSAAMAAASLSTAIVGMYLFQRLNGNTLRTVLGGSCLAFAALYVIILAVQTMRRRQRRLQRQQQQQQQQQQQAGGVYSDALAMTRRTTSASSAPTGSASASAVTVAQSPHSSHVAARDDAVNNNSNGAAARSTMATNVTTTSSSSPTTTTAVSPSSSTFVARESYSHTLSPYTPHEARTPVVTETTVLPPPPLTPSKLSPSRTLTQTRVRVNRNLDERGKIRLRTKVAAAVAAAVSGLMGSLTGVGAPPQIIFVLLYDVPSYIIRVNFCAQSIPSAAYRFVVAVATPLLTREMVPLLATSVVSGYAGMWTGVKLGNVFGPRSFSVFVLALLLVASLVMVTTNVWVLIGSTTLCAVASGVVAWHEHRATCALKAATLQAQQQQQGQVQAQAEASRATAVAVQYSDDKEGGVCSSSGGGDGTRAGRRAARHRPPPLPLPALLDGDGVNRVDVVAETSTTRAMQREDVRLPASEECSTARAQSAC